MATENLRYNIILNDQVSAGLAKIEARLSSLESGFNKSNKAASSMNGFMKGSFMIQGAGMLANIASQAWAMAEGYVQSAGSLQANTNALKVASGSTEQFGKNQEFLKSLTDRMPISIVAASEGLKMWTAATKTSKIAGDTARTMFEDVSVATASMGIDAETSKGIFLALSQMMSKGTVSAEELRGQLGERLPGAFALMASSMGVSEQRLGKMMEQGQVISEDVLPNFTRVLREEFGTGLAQSANSINAVTTRLENMKTRGIIAMTPFINDMALSFERFVLAIAAMDFEPLLDSARPLLATLDLLGDSFGRLFGTAGGGDVIMKSLATTFHLLMSPFYTIISLISAVTEAVVGMNEAIKASLSGDFAGAADKIAASGKRIGEIYRQNSRNTTGALIDIWDDRGKRNESNLSWLDEGKKTESNLSWLDKKSSTGIKMFGGGGKSKELEKASTNISGSAPRNTTIQINSLIGQNNNYISNVSDPYKDLSTFMEKLKQALSQEIVDVNIQVG